MNRLFTLFFLIAFFSIGAFSQDAVSHKCGTDMVIKKMIENNPQMLQQLQRNEEARLNQSSKDGNQKRQITYTVPVVVHIVHENGSENISNGQVVGAIQEMNEDFQKLNSDTSLVASAFQSIIGNMDMRFRLATKDPNGNCTNGIERIFDPSFTNDGGINSNGNVYAHPNPWDRDKYLNIWVVKNIASGAGAYAFLASQNVGNGFDGVTSRASQFGVGNSRTLTHEVGHYFDLYHTWANLSGGVGSGQPGDPANCNLDDLVGDTPNTIGTTSGCNLSQNTCGSLDNVNNFMDYASCPRMFTNDQVTRMIESITTIGAGRRDELVSPANLIATGTDDASYQTPACPPSIDFVVNKNKECEGGQITFTDRSFHAVESSNNFSYSWSFPGGTPTTSTMKNPTVTYNTAGIYDVSLTVSIPSATGQPITRTNLIEIIPGSGSFIAPFIEQASDPLWPNNSDPTLIWTRDKPTGSLFQFQRSTNAFYSPPSSIYLNNFGFNGTGQFNLITPIMDLTNMQAGSTFLNFQVAHAQKASEQEGISLWISTDCGETFTFNKAWGGNLINSVPSTSSSFTPSGPGDWNFISYDISSLAGLDNIQFRFRFSASSGNNLWLDDIHISDNDQPFPLTTGLRKDLFGDFNLYPNPNDGVFTIEFNVSRNDKVNAEIIDMIGKSTSLEFDKSISSGWNTAIIDTRKYDLKPGVYFLKLKSGDQVFSKRLMIQ